MKKRERIIKAWADVGSHGGIFEFETGNYPKMLHIYSKQVTPDLIPVTVHYDFPTKDTHEK